MKTQCPHCNEIYEVSDEFEDKELECGIESCNKTFLCVPLNGVPDSMACPVCKEDIKFGALKCKHCGERLDPNSALQTKKTKRPLIVSFIVFILISVIMLVLFWGTFFTPDKLKQSPVKNDPLAGICIEVKIPPPLKVKLTPDNIGEFVKKHQAELVLIKTLDQIGTTTGSGFIAVFTDGIFLVTNKHVLIGDWEQTTFITISGHELNLLESISINKINKPLNQYFPSYETILNSDIVRLKLDSSATLSKGLKLATSFPLIGEKVFALGDSGGEGIFTALEGKIQGVGNKEIELNAEFIPGNSGGPIINQQGEVIAIATRLKKRKSNWVNKNTRFEKPRRFGVIIPQEGEWVVEYWDTHDNNNHIIEYRKLQDLENFLDYASYYMHINIYNINKIKLPSIIPNFYDPFSYKRSLTQLKAEALETITGSSALKIIGVNTIHKLLEISLSSAKKQLSQSFKHSISKKKQKALLAFIKYQEGVLKQNKTESDRAAENQNDRDNAYQAIYKKYKKTLAWHNKIVKINNNLLSQRKSIMRQWDNELTKEKLNQKKLNSYGKKIDIIDDKLDKCDAKLTELSNTLKQQQNNMDYYKE